jgi:hypothetical protein
LPGSTGFTAYETRPIIACKAGAWSRGKHVVVKLLDPNYPISTHWLPAGAAGATARAFDVILAVFSRRRVPVNTVGPPGLPGFLGSAVAE